MGKKETEKYLERRLRVKVEETGGYCFKFLPFNVAGIPDRICLIPMGHLVFAEVKGTGEKPEPLQKVWIKRLRRIGFRVEVIDSSKQIEDLINEFKNEK